MPQSKAASQMVHDQEGIQAKHSSMADDGERSRSSKKRGDLAAKLNPLLEPRLSPGQPGRPKGVTNYEWTPETDRLLIDLSARLGAAKAKRVVGRKIQEGRPAAVTPRPESVRKAVEHRMAKLGIANGQKRKNSATREARRWTESQTTALLGALGADATIESIAARTGHSVKSVRAKIARLAYEADEIHGSTVFTADALAAHLHVTPRQIRRWRERGWLATKNRRITGQCVRQFLRAHPDRIPFENLPRVDQVFLIGLGFPSLDAATFKKNVRDILDGIGRERKPRRPPRRGNATPMGTDVGEEDVDRDDASAFTVGTSA